MTSLLMSASGSSSTDGSLDSPFLFPARSLATPGPTQAPDLAGMAAAAGLTGADTDRIEAAIAAGYADSTRNLYAWAWRRFEAWCDDRRITPLPAAPAAVCAYLTERAEQGASVPSIDQACSAISYQHRHCGVADPIAHDVVRRVRRGLRRTIGIAPRRLARPLEPSDVRQIVAGIDRDTAKGARDAAIILLGFASALRSTELTSLRLADITVKPAGLLLHVRRSKTDPDGRGQVVGVAYGKHAETDPVAALDAWMTLRGRAPGRVFTSMRPGRVGLDPISGAALARMVKERAGAVGLGADRITGHSLRAGHVTTAAAAGAGVALIAAQTRHRRIETLLDHYIRPAEALAVTTSRHLGL